MKKEEILNLIESTNWYHTFEILPGIWTNGKRGYKVVPKDRLDYAGVPANLSGISVLDIGTFDGMYAWELERRGATVYAVDIQDPDSTAFNTAKKILNSKVSYTRSTVYEILNVDLPKFDLILFFGVFYHLKHPVLAFRRLRQKLTDNGTIHLDGVVLDYLWNRYPELDDYKEEIEKIRHLPICYYSDPRRESWNWSFPTKSCVEKWLTTSGFKETQLKLNAKGSAIVGNAKAANLIPVEHEISNQNKKANFTTSLKEEIY